MSDLRVFVSSTFQDLQEEREHLMKKIFPEIRALCRERGVTFTEIDLRWGLTEEEATLGRIIRTCLEEVEKCRPYFIGMIGNRYGWTPELHEILIDPELLGKFPWIEEIAMQGASLTEMEFIHGVFDAPEVDGDYAFFYHRAGDSRGADDPERLASLIERSRTCGRPFRECQSVDELGEQVRADLVEMVDRYWPEREAPTPLEIERRAHASFAASRIRAYIPNPEYLKRWNEWIDFRLSKADIRLEDPSIEHPKPVLGGIEESRIRNCLVITGESGLGKSSLVAYLTDYYRKKNPTALVIEHYVGASQTSGSAASVMRHLVEEIRDRFNIAEEIPGTEDELQRSFANWLFRCEHLAARDGISVMIAIDAVNQLGESSRRMSWLPKIIPQGITLMVSTTPGETEDRLLERPWERLVVTPLIDERVRQSIVVRYLGEFKKGIAPEQVRRVTGDPKASSPLYLRVVAEEMRLHGEHETLDEKINRYVDAADLHEVFDRVLERIERDYGHRQARNLLSAIWASRAGLGEEEIMAITGVSRLDLSRLLFAIDYHFVQREGLLGFFHDYLRRAVENRYLLESGRAQQVQGAIAHYFETTPLTERTALELLWQYGAGGEASAERDARLAATLARADVLELLYRDETKTELLRRWRQLAERGYIAGVEYRKSLMADSEGMGANRGKVLQAAGALLESMSQWDVAGEMYGELVTWARAHADKSYEMRGRQGLGLISLRHGEYEAALEHHREANRIALQTGDRSGSARANGSIGLVHAEQGRYSEALECLRLWYDLSEDIGDRAGTAAAISNMGIVHQNQMRYSEALECFGRQLAINEEIGDRSGVAYAIGNMGGVHLVLGRLSEALECFSRWFDITSELDNRNGIAIALGNMGSVYEHLGEFERALECYTQAAEGHRSLGFPFGLTYWLHGTATTILTLTTARQMPEYLPRFVAGATEETWRTMSLRVARASAEECISISDQLGKPDTQLHARLLLARVDAAEGRIDVAAQQLGALLAEATNDEQRVWLHFWLWRIGYRVQGAEETELHRREALRLCTDLYGKISGHAYHQIIDELTANATPTEASDAPE